MCNYMYYFYNINLNENDMKQLIEKAQALRVQLNAIIEAKKAEISQGTNDEYAQETIDEINSVITEMDEVIESFKVTDALIKEGSDLIDDIAATYAYVG